MVRIYSSHEIKNIAAAGEILAKVFENLKREIQVGTSLKDLDNLAFRLTREMGAEPAFFGYRPEGVDHAYEAALCTSIDNVIVHGVPTNYRVKSGDVLKIDFGVKYKNFYADSAFTVIVNKGTKMAEKLVSATRKALDEAIKQVKPGHHLGDIGWVIERVARKNGFRVAKELTGHGIGVKLHEEPTILNFGKKGEGILLKSGMVLAIEPMFSAGSADIISLKDESWATADGSLSAHFEHTVAVTEKGPLVLTKQF